MADDWMPFLFQVSLTIAVALSTLFTIFLVTLPTQFEPLRPGKLSEHDFTTEDKDDADRSGYALFRDRKDDKGELKTECSVQIVVLGDIGRSPRMQYHALSIASLGGRVNIIGYVDSDVHPDILASRLITITPIRPFPKRLQTDNKLAFLLLAPFKILWQTLFLYHALGYRSVPTRWMLVQNPPSIPTLMVAQFSCFVRNTRLIIDWHNFGYSILALRLGPRHPVVKLAEWSEGFFAWRAEAHFAVTDAMVRVLRDKWGIAAQALHDRPPKHFQPLSRDERSTLLHRLPETAPHAADIERGACRLLVSSTSWTADEDFSLLLDALVAYSASASASSKSPNLPRILAIITGKGPQKPHYLSLIRALTRANRLPPNNVLITTAWLPAADYARLLGAADLGVSLHTSSSGVDLPMKVVDMFGTGLPVAGWSRFEAWPELVREGVNGRGFESAEELAGILEELFHGQGGGLEVLRRGSLRECERRWEGEWGPVAGRLLKLE